MKLLKTIGSRIIVVVTTLIVFAAIVGGVALWAVTNYQNDAEQVVEKASDAIVAFEVDLKILQMIRAEKDFVLTQNPKFKDENLSLRSLITTDVEKAAEVARDEAEKTIIVELNQKVSEYDQGFAKIVNAIEKIGGEEGLAQAEELTQSSSNVLAQEMLEAIGKIVEVRNDQIIGLGEDAANTAATAQLAEIIVLIIAILSGIVIAFWLVRSTNKTLQNGINRLVTAADTVFGFTKQLTGQ
ncbi:MAG: MCP four helix bundle domain-containing protein, partial [Candidatus Falkowbacteria bacterium]